MSLKSTFVRIPSNKNISQSFHIGCGSSDDLSLFQSKSLPKNYKLQENIILLHASSYYNDNDEKEYEKINKEEDKQEDKQEEDKILCRQGYFSIFNEYLLEIFLNVGKALIEQQKDK